jgi:putative transposase
VNASGFIEAERSNFSVPLMCRMLGVSRSGYYYWKGRPPSQRSREDAALTERLHEIHRRSRATYGSPRVHAELRAIGICCSRKRVARLMRKEGLKGCLRGRKKHTTRRDGRAVAAPNPLRWNFAAVAPNRLWVADITYVRSEEGFLYLAFVLDAYSSRLVGLAMATHLCTELVVDALQMATWRRRPSARLIHHSDQGVQYTTLSFNKRLEEAGIVPSMGRVGSAYNNSLAKSFIATLKTELLYSDRGLPESRRGRQSSSAWRASTTGRGCTLRRAIEAQQTLRRVKCGRLQWSKENLSVVRGEHQKGPA